MSEAKPGFYRPGISLTQTKQRRKDMKTKALVTMLLLLLCTMVFASEDAGDAAEHARKTRELNQLAERFKAETGFTGRINYGYERMRLGSFEGNFSGIHFSAEEDTIAFRQACESIVEKILPLSPANRMQLSMSRISKSVRGYTTDYNQQVGGYRVEGAGFIMITYDEGRKRFSIGDNTVELPDGVQINISLTQAIETAKEVYNPAYKRDKSVQFSEPRTELLYTNDPHNTADSSYRLNYKISYWGLAIYIDPVNGNLSYTRSFLIEDFQSHADGFIYTPNYTSSAIDTLGYHGLYKVTFEQENDGWLYPYITDKNGDVLVTENIVDSLHVILKNEAIYRLVEYPDTLHAVVADSVSIDQDSVRAVFKDNASSSVNVYHHTTNQYYVLKELLDFNAVGYRIILNMPDSSGYNGICDPNYAVIRLITSAGQYSHVARHEMSHAFIFSALDSHFFNDTQSSTDYGCMDEAFAVYLPCSVLNHEYYIPSGSTSYNLSNTVHISTQYSTVNENIYAHYWARYPLASAWWSLRSDPEYCPTAVDNLLIAGLGIVRRDIVDNAAYRYKPRYFYNILMDRVDDGSAPHSLNPKQKAITKAYESRGFHFTPQVESFSEGNRSRNVFSPGDQVHAKITKAPQNTAFTVYVIRHGDYTYLDGANVSTLTSHYNTDHFSPITGNSTNAAGEWDGLIWTIPTEAGNVDGGYDIIVDFGSPEAPDDHIHFTYTAANVMDGIDGLHEPGFRVHDDSMSLAMKSSEINASPFWK
jgi:hypothetical protein